MKTVEQYKTGNLKNTQLDELKGLFQSALSDGRISTKELAQIQFFYYDSHLSEKDFSLLKDGVFKELVDQVIADHHISEHEHKSILRIAKQLNISSESREWAQQVMQDHAATDEAAAGATTAAATVAAAPPESE